MLNTIKTTKIIDLYLYNEKWIKINYKKDK